MEKELVGKYTMPGIGLGMLGHGGDAAGALVEAALADGYRYIDTSRFYGNEEAVGRALASSSVPRSDVWVTKKLLHPRTPPQPDLAFELEKSLRLLQTDYVDLLLMHWPRPDVSLEWALGEFAARRHLSVAQVVLRWLVQQERLVAIPGAANVEQLRENLKVLDVTLARNEIAGISWLTECAS